MKKKGPNPREKDKLTVWKSPVWALRNICTRGQKIGVDIKAKKDIHVMVVITLVKNKKNASEGSLQVNADRVNS